MADNIVRLKLDSATFDANIKSAAAGLARMERECRRVGGTLEVVEKDQLDYVKALGSMETKSDSARGRMRELGDAIKNATMVYNGLSDAEKKSEFGKALADGIDKLKNRLAPLKDMVADLDQEFKNMASDTAFTDGINMMTRSVGSCASAMVAWTGGGKEMEAVIKDLAKVQTTVAAVEALTKAFQKQNLTLLKNPLVLMATGAIALTAALVKLTDTTSEATKATEKIAEKMGDEYAEVEALNTIVHDNTLAIDQRREALEQLQKLVPDYHASLDEEGRLLNDNTKALDDYKKKLLETAAAEAFKEELKDEIKEMAKAQAKAAELQNELARLAASGELTAEKEDLLNVAIAKCNNEADEHKKKIDETATAYETARANLTGWLNGLDKLGAKLGALGREAPSTAGSVLTNVVNENKNNNENTTKTTKTSSQNFTADTSISNMKDLRSLSMSSTQSMTTLMQNKSYWDKVANESTDIFTKSFAKSMSEKIEREMKVQDVAISIGADTSAIADISDTINNTLEGIELEPLPINFEVDQEALNRLVKDGKETQKAWMNASSAIGSIGSALSSIEDPGAKVAGIIAQAIATIASTFAASLKGTFTPWDWIAGAAAGTATMVSTITAIKSATEYHADGGVVGKDVFVPRGTDTVPAMLTPGEIVLSAANQKMLASNLTNNNSTIINNNQSQGSSTMKVRGSDLYIIMNNHLRSIGHNTL